MAQVQQIKQQTGNFIHGKLVAKYKVTQVSYTDGGFKPNDPEEM